MPFKQAFGPFLNCGLPCFKENSAYLITPIFLDDDIISMSEHIHSIPFEMHDTPASLPSDIQALLTAALDATDQSYAPHSQFRVGSAVLLTSGEIITGCNQENAAYPSGLCAERVALYAVGAQGKATDIQAIAIRARTDNFAVNRPPTSCGDCRQVMLEFEARAGRPMICYFQGASGPILKVSGISGAMMPFPFDLLD